MTGFLPIITGFKKEYDWNYSECKCIYPKYTGCVLVHAVSVPNLNGFVLNTVGFFQHMTRFLLIWLDKS